MQKLTVVIITLNDAMRLPDCIQSVTGLADDILVVDSGSSDQTLEIARAAGTRILENPWMGYAAQWKFALENAVGKWCLILNADEQLTPELRNAIATAMTRDDHDAYSIPFQTVMAGKKLRHGVSRTKRYTRLLRRDAARFVQRGKRDEVILVRDAASGTPVRIGQIRQPILQEQCTIVADYLQSMNEKTSMRAWESYKNGERFQGLSIASIPLKFLYRYVLMLGFLDGFAGFSEACFEAMSDFIFSMKLLDMDRFAKLAEESGENLPRALTPGTPLEMAAIRGVSAPPRAIAPTVEMPASSVFSSVDELENIEENQKVMANEVDGSSVDDVQQMPERTDVENILTQAVADVERRAREEANSVEEPGAKSDGEVVS